MKKIKLHLDELAVETFHPVPCSAGSRGTVRGLESQPEEGCTQYMATCVYGTCNGSCITCPGLEGCTGPYWVCTE